MSIDPHWYSTMYSWYTFASTFVSGISLMAIFVIYLKNRGQLEYVTEEHLHDLGKFAERARIPEAREKDVDGNTRQSINELLCCPEYNGRPPVTLRSVD